LVLLATCITPVSALGLSFDPENWGKSFLRGVDRLSTGCMTLYTEDRTLQFWIWLKDARYEVITAVSVSFAVVLDATMCSLIEK
jgi:hypothetical protein